MPAEPAAGRCTLHPDRAAVASTTGEHAYDVGSAEPAPRWHLCAECAARAADEQDPDLAWGAAPMDEHAPPAAFEQPALFTAPRTTRGQLSMGGLDD